MNQSNLNFSDEIEKESNLTVTDHAINYIKNNMLPDESYENAVERIISGDRLLLTVNRLDYAVFKRNLLEDINVYLPACPNNARAAPNGLLRSALFGAIRKGTRKALNKEKIASFGDVEIRYTGFQLDQNDLTVWESVLHAVKEQRLGDRCKISLYSILKIMGKTNGGANRNSLHSSITRLAANAVEIRHKRYMYSGSLVQEFYKDEETEEYLIVINPKLKNLYQPDTFTYIDWKIRSALEGKQLAQWLHGFYETHANPYPVKIETLHSLSGSSTGDMWKFTQNLKKALSDLQAASESQGKKFNFKIQNSLVFVEKTMTNAQQRHLNSLQEKA